MMDSCSERKMMTIWSMCLIFSLSNSILVIASPVRHLCPPDQRDALLEFKSEFYVEESADFDFSMLPVDKKTERWRNNTDCCFWDGVSCDPKTGKVIELNLTLGALNGPLRSNSSLFRLQHLQSLVLDRNNISGVLPDSIGNLKYLRVLTLKHCRFFGKIPSSIGNLSHLTDLYLYDNDFTGGLPDSMGNLKQLTKLLLGYNKLSGNFPPMLLNLSELTYISLRSNQFKGNNLKINSALHLPPSIDSLVLSSCNISEFPKFLQTQANLSNLDVSVNQIEGQIPEWLWGLPKLRYVNISHNSFSGVEGSLDVMQRSVSIEMLDISSNNFQGPFLLLPNSTNYFLGSDNRFSGEIPKAICKLVNLTTLVLSNNNFSGSIPRCFENFKTTIYALHLQNNSLSGGFPDEAVGDQLRSLDIGHNRLSGELPKSLINCTSLEFLNVEDNKFNDTFPFWLRLLPKLQILVLRSNDFHGPISSPGVSSSFPKLRIYDISENRFDGVLPSDYFAGWSEMSVEIMFSKYTGSGSSVYQHSVVLTNKGLKMELIGICFTMYKTIDISGNRLEGDVPESIGSLKGLHVLNISNNRFTGPLPQSLTNLTNLQSLDLSENILSGKIPPELGKLSFLEWMNFSYNKLEGPIPQGPQIQTQNSSSFAENPGLCGAPLQKTCGRGEEEATTQEQDKEKEEKDEVFSWTAAAISYVPGVFCGFTIGYILTSYKHDWIMKIFHFFCLI